MELIWIISHSLKFKKSYNLISLPPVPGGILGIVVRICFCMRCFDLINCVSLLYYGVLCYFAHEFAVGMDPN